MNLSSISGFCDLNITHNVDDRLLQRIVECNNIFHFPSSSSQNVFSVLKINYFVADGYRAIALNYTIDVSKSDGKLPSKKKKGSTDGPELVTFPKQLAATQTRLISVSVLFKKVHSFVNYFYTDSVLVLQKYSDKLKVFLRITVIFAKPDQLKLVVSLMTTWGIELCYQNLTFMVSV